MIQMSSDGVIHQNAEPSTVLLERAQDQKCPWEGVYLLLDEEC